MASASDAPIEKQKDEEAPSAAVAAIVEEAGPQDSKSSTPERNVRSPERRQSTILDSMTSQLVGDEDGSAEPSESQPLLRNQTGTREGNREQYRRNERSVARQLLERYACPLCICGIIFFSWSLAAFVFYLYGWWVWWHYGDSAPCDQPLGFWLLLQLIVATSATLSSLCPHGLRIIMRFIPWITLSLGIYWVLISKTCAKTNPELFNFVKLYIIFLAVTYLAWVTLTVLLVSLLIYAAMNGWLGPTSGASPETITKIETWKYDPSVFCDPENPSDGRPPHECCVCSESYSPEVPMKKTPCGHYFHTECLEKWLKVAKTCPLCRLDLEDAVQDPESQMADS
eukprot:gnl/MRDRNA2_/MRDRNA2_119366_c0_seq1.p1 gnl/MRDRNA2_/MRDRNA2_119366_c0~~gnl/MRDRNA2_/MRDRNA2_119366_c0_seq1.p1  ORF type:complete len:341 (-),score=36.11 gnl/MRDRNA2_/MRDRNA2_119366_c0_seq1:108-1130(-)